MDLDIYTTTKHWKFSAQDEEAEEKFRGLEQTTRKSAPEDFYHSNPVTNKEQTILHLDFMKNSPLYPLLQSLPKGVLHHIHIDCCQDVQFYRRHVIHDPRVYMTKDLKEMRIGTKVEAEKEGWVSMNQQSKNYPSEQAFAEKVASITMLTKKELQSMSFIQNEMWQRFQQKISNFFVIVFALDLFKKYIKHVLLKFIANGYDRVEFRAFLGKLKEYDTEGNVVKEHDEKMYMDAFDEVYAEVRKDHPRFTAGFIFFGLKVFSPEMNQALFTKICELQWDKTIGLDFVQQEDQFGSLLEYDPIIDKVLAKFPHLDYKKVYHAGQTKNHRTHNLDVAVKAGSVRIGHGFNVLQRMEFLPHCRNICFEKSPLSNIVLGYNSDAREASAPVLLGLGFAVTINPDDPGKFGVDDNTVDYFLAAISYNWTLRDLKLIAYHSINHAICDQHTRSVLIKDFQTRWNSWVRKFLGNEHVEPIHRWIEPDIYTGVRGWSWNQKEINALDKFQKIRQSAIDSLPEGFYQEKMLSHLKFMRQQPLYKAFKTLPKGAMHHLHFDCNEDPQFYLKCIIGDSKIFLDKTKKSFKIGTKKQAIQSGWLNWQHLSKQFGGDQQLADYLYSLTAFTHQEMLEAAGSAIKFWPPFQQKITTFNTLLSVQDIFQRYSDYVLRKYIANGYERIEFRALLTGLKQYSQEGELIKEHNQKAFVDSFERVYGNIRKEMPSFTVGFIFFGLKNLSDEANQAILRTVMELNWKLTIGIDFVQEEQPYGSLQKYDKIADKVLKDYPEQHVKKCYHAGDTRNHQNRNIEVALKGGSARIGHGLNIIQHTQIIPLCSGVCFQLCPVSNVITGSTARQDLRLSTAPILVGLGIPVSLNPDDPGKFGYEDSTVDFFCAGVSFNWTLKHFKLTALQSINHAICSQGIRIKAHSMFKNSWQNWIQKFLAE